jgi:MOB kinase activator 1
VRNAVPRPSAAALFPQRQGAPFPKNFADVVRKIFTRLFRVYAHIYHSHFQRICSLGAEAGPGYSIPRSYGVVLESTHVTPHVTPHVTLLTPSHSRPRTRQLGPCTAAHLNTCFKHFIYFTGAFTLVKKEELAPLAELVDGIMVGRGRAVYCSPHRAKHCQPCVLELNGIV